MERVMLDGTLAVGDGEDGAYRAVLMRPGEWAGKRLRAAPEVVRRAAGLFEGQASFLNPPPPAAGEHGYPGLQHLLGTVRAARWDEAEGAIVGEYVLYPTPAAQWFGQVVDRVLADRAAGRPAPHIGLSAVVRVTCGPAGADGVREVREIVEVEQVDAVHRPAAGGEFVGMLDAKEGAVNGEQGAVNGEQGAVIGEQAVLAVEAVQDDRAAERSLLLETALGAAGLPAAFERLVRADLPADWSAGQLKGRIQAAREAWGETLRPRTVAGHPPVSGMRDSVDQITEAFAALMEARRPNDAHPLSGVREFYLALSGDYEMAGVFHGERVMLANVTSTTMASIVANVMNKVVVQEFQNYPRWWEPICRVENFNTLQQVRWVMLGGVGELPTVAEGAAYTELTWDDAHQTASWVKKGGYLGLTLEAMDTDDVGRLRAAPRALAQAAWLTLGKSVAAVFTASGGVGPTLADSKALFHADHGNLGTTALERGELGRGAAGDAQADRTEQRRAAGRADQPALSARAAGAGGHGGDAASPRRGCRGRRTTTSTRRRRAIRTMRGWPRRGGASSWSTCGRTPTTGRRSPIRGSTRRSGWGSASARRRRSSRWRRPRRG